MGIRQFCPQRPKRNRADQNVNRGTRIGGQIGDRFGHESDNVRTMVNEVKGPAQAELERGIVGELRRVRGGRAPMFVV
jgi:hypothetical protein